jgi:hypothetical protein
MELPGLIVGTAIYNYHIFVDLRTLAFAYSLLREAHDGDRAPPLSQRESDGEMLRWRCVGRALG